MPILRFGICVFGTVCLLVFLLGSSVEAKKKRRSGSSSSFKILQVTPSPLPFEAGNGELTFSTLVRLPRNLKGIDILEISTLITSPTQRSMRFLTQRVLLGEKTSKRSGSKISTELNWDGRDQTSTFVKPGMYRYEVRAKLMAEKGTDIRTRIVSRRSRGTVEVTKYDAPEPPPVTIEELGPTLDPELGSPSPGGDDTVPSIAVEPAADEVEMLLDESTSHPLPEPGDEGEGVTEEGEVLEIPQEG